MAKDVDLSSKEWTDLIFEGRNKSYGAYELRSTSVARHNKSVLFTLLGAILIVGLVWGYATVQNIIAERSINEGGEQENVMVEMATEEPEPEPEQQKLEQPEPEVLPEEVLKTVKVTELRIVEDKEVKKEDEIKTKDELQEETAAFGQTTNKEGTEDRNVTKEAKDVVVVEQKEDKPKVEPEKIFNSVEQMPEFPGGHAALLKYLNSHIQYPPQAAENGKEGKVTVQFVVEKDGHVGEVRVIRSVDKDLDREAVRVCKTLPKFTPGRQNGQPARVWFTLPVVFKLQGS